MKDKEDPIMRNLKFAFTALLLASLSAVAQQSTEPSTMAAAPSESAAAASQPTASTSTQPSTAASLAAPAGEANCASNHGRRGESRHRARTCAYEFPEKPHPGRRDLFARSQGTTISSAIVPKPDHYFLGRMDLGESVDRRDYLVRRQEHQENLLGV